MRRFRHPFTLVELLCVVIVIALLAAMSVKVTQIAYLRADNTRTKTLMEIFRTANEQYKIKNGYYLPGTGTGYEGAFGSIELDANFFGDAYETCKATSSGNKFCDAWGREFRYRCPGKFNTGSYDLYSIGKDGETLICDPTNTANYTKLKKSGLGDDIANFKDPSIK